MSYWNGVRSKSTLVSKSSDRRYTLFLGDVWVPLLPVFVFFSSFPLCACLRMLSYFTQICLCSKNSTHILKINFYHQ